MAKGGAKKIMVDYDGNGEPVGLAFAIGTPKGFVCFQLPANINGVYEVFKKQKVRADIEQAKATAWRNVRDWVLAQMAFIEAGNATLQETFLPYLTDKTGRTLYEVYSTGQLLIDSEVEE